MNAKDVIESYVADVGARLPRKQRNDVAFELRALLEEELQARAEGAEHDPEAAEAAEAAAAMELVRDFGRPSEVAARYRPSLTIIDPADGHGFLRAATVGLAIIWSLGLLEHVGKAFSAGGVDSGWDLLTLLGQWWVRTVIPSLWWPGVLVVGFGASAWVRRRWPQTPVWKPRMGDGVGGGRSALVLGILGILFGLYILIEPRWVLDLVWGGLAAPAAYDALTYTDSFRRLQGPWLLGLLVLNIPLLTAVVIKSRWSPLLRRLEILLGLLTCGTMLWAVAGGPIFMAPASDRLTKVLFVLIVLYVLADRGVRWLRRIRPAPN